MHVKLKLLAVLASLWVSNSGFAQTGTIDLRVGKLEKEMKAVQRTVFPQGVPVQPEMGGAGSPAIAAGSPAAPLIADLTARIDALEKGLASLTGQVEQAGFRNRQQDEMLTRMEVRLLAVEGVGATARLPAATVPAANKTSAATGVTRPTSPAINLPSTKPDTARKAAIAAVEIPSTGDAPEDAYSYGFRLYSAKLYPEAQTKLKEVVAKYPSHRRASYAQNLLGRAYYDEGKPALASVAFYDNYQKMPTGERAPESLYWLGQALIKLKKLPDACKVYDELREVYAGKLSSDLKAKAVKGRVDAKCTA